MPLIPVVAALLFVFGFILSMPFLLVLRYRAGTARRMGRRWIATTNLVAMIFSAGFFIWMAAVTNFWVPRAFNYSLIGLMAGILLGGLGLVVTRWEQTGRTLQYTPNRWLVFVITLAVTTRLLYSLWRIWHFWRMSGSDGSWLAAAGVAGSLAVGAIVVGYYLTYSAGVRWRLGKVG